MKTIAGLILGLFPIAVIGTIVYSLQQAAQRRLDDAAKQWHEAASDQPNGNLKVVEQTPGVMVTTTTTGTVLNNQSDTEAELRKLALAKEPEVLAQKDEIAAALAEEYAADQASFRLQVSRWGDFLRLSVARGNDNFATAINLSRVATINLVEGHPPDNKGEVGYSVALVDDRDGTKIFGDLRGYDPKRYHYEVTPSLPSAKFKRGIFYLPEPVEVARGFSGSSSVSYYTSFPVGWTVYGGRGGDVTWYGGSSAGYRTAHYPRAAADDKIHFSGLGAILYVPAGKGKAVLDMILAASGKDEAKAP